MSKQWVRDDDERTVKALFKWASNAEKRYALAMERVAYALADSIGVPVPITYLDSRGSTHGAAQMVVPGIAWKQAAAGVPWLLTMVENDDTWPLAAAFDVWMGHPDRRYPRSSPDRRSGSLRAAYTS